jgi:hypothetical protein
MTHQAATRILVGSGTRKSRVEGVGCATDERLWRGGRSHRAHASPLQALRCINLLAQPPAQRGSRLAALDVVSSVAR